MNDDIYAARTLEAAFQRLNRKIPDARTFLALLAMSLLLSNYGQIGSPVTHNWLGAPDGSSPCTGVATHHGCIRAYRSSLDGAMAMVERVLGEVPESVLSSGDIGILTWAILLYGYKPPMTARHRWWRLMRKGLAFSFQRIAASLGTDTLWTSGSFEPPPEAPDVWTHDDAERLLDAFLPSDTSTTTRVGLLMWAYVGANYGETEDGQQTHNWAMDGVLVKEGRRIPDDHVVDSLGLFAIKVYPSMSDGLRSFVKKTAGVEAIQSGDIGKLAEAMIVHNALGAPLHVDEQCWSMLVAKLQEASKNISSDLNYGELWSQKYVPSSIKKDVEGQAKEIVKPPPRQFPWHWLAMAIPVGLAGAGMFYGYKKLKASEEEEQKKKLDEAAKAIKGEAHQKGRHQGLAGLSSTT